MAKKHAPAKPKPVEAIVHNDKRPNLPTADAQEFVAPEIEAPKKLLYKRRPELDPQLVWRGKDAQDRADLEVDAPPIYIQEKIDPRVLIEGLRTSSRDLAQDTELRLFDSFDGLGELELIEFYQHSANWSNRMILGDSLNVMASLAEREGLRGQVQMIYMDPPYGIRFGSNWQASVRDRDVKDGNLEDAAREVEQIRAFRDTWELGIHSYLGYLRDRLMVARDLLNESGAVFLQMGDENVHLVRSIMDEVFGSNNFAGQIAFSKTSSQSTTRIQSVFDVLLVYAKSVDSMKYRDLVSPKKPGERGAKQYTLLFSPDLSTYRRMTAAELQGTQALPVGWRVGRLGPVLSQDAQKGPRSEPYSWDGEPIPVPSNTHWKYDPLPGGGMDRLRALGRLRRSGRSLATVLLAEDNPTTPLDNVWLDTGTGSFTEDQIYVVQTANKVVQRCMLMATDPGDLVLDPTCGSGTTAFVAEQWGRRWITIDTSRVALALARQRLMGARFPYYLLADSPEGRAKEEQLTGQVLPRQEHARDVRLGFVYERITHVTLGSIANNPDIKTGMSPAQVNVAIARHAETQLLFDRPVDDEKRARVAGPFTVESLSPHRSLAFAHPAEPITERAATQVPTATTFEDTILTNLAKAGIQNGKRKERLEFADVQARGGTYIQAVGIPKDADPQDGKLIALSIGPQYGTVGPPFIKAAAREAMADQNLGLLCILGFAFDPLALGATEEYNASTDGFASVTAERSLGRMPVLLVRMNADLVMGEDLKKTGAGNLFTVFGEPDITIESRGSELTVELRGIDVYDPTTGDVRSDSADRIAMWMVDTAYNGESFFVRHCYFTGGIDPFERLKAALAAEIDEAAWKSLYRTRSRPFPRPESGKIAVKVINDYGDEVLKVFDV